MTEKQKQDRIEKYKSMLEKAYKELSENRDPVQDNANICVNTLECSKNRNGETEFNRNGTYEVERKTTIIIPAEDEKEEKEK